MKFLKRNLLPNSRRELFGYFAIILGIEIALVMLLEGFYFIASLEIMIVTLLVLSLWGQRITKSYQILLDEVMNSWQEAIGLLKESGEELKKKDELLAKMMHLIENQKDMLDRYKSKN